MPAWDRRIAIPRGRIRLQFPLCAALAAVLRELCARLPDLRRQLRLVPAQVAVTRRQVLDVAALLDGQQQLSATYAKGARGKLQVLALVKGFDTSGPVMLTFSGEGSRRFLDILQAFRQSVIAQAGALRKRQDKGFKGFPLYAFWLPVKAGERVEVGKPVAASFITPPVAAWDGEGLKDTAKRADILRGLFVGKALLEHCEALYDEAAAWAQAWQAGLATGTQGNGDDVPMPEEPSLPEEEIL